MYLVENESDPVRFLSVGLPQCSGRVKLSLKFNMHAQFLASFNFTLAHSMTTDPWGRARAIPPMEGSWKASRQSLCFTCLWER